MQPVLGLVDECQEAGEQTIAAAVKACGVQDNAEIDEVGNAN